MPGKDGGKAKPLKSAKVNYGDTIRLDALHHIDSKPPFIALQAAPKDLTPEDIAFKKKQADEAKALKEAAAKLGGKKK
jgi:hypothetical protein